MTIDDFVAEITKPLYVYRMARAVRGDEPLNNYSNPGMQKSAETRMKNAKKEIQKIVEKYAAYMDDDGTWD